MLYAFISVLIIILLGMMVFTILKARQNGTDYYMNMILLKRYNHLVKKLLKQEKEKFSIVFQTKKVFTKNDFKKNIDVIKKVDKNFALLKKMEEGKLSRDDVIKEMEKNLKIVLCDESFCYKDKTYKMEHLFDLAKKSILQHHLSAEISPIFGNAKAYFFDNTAIIPVENRYVIIDLNDVFETEIYDEKDISIKLKLKENHEVEYDGDLPLEELDFRQEETTDDNGIKNIETYVKCCVFRLTLKVKGQEYVKDIHLMRVDDIKFAKSLC